MYLPNWIENLRPHKNLPPRFTLLKPVFGFIEKHQKLERTKMFFPGEWTDKLLHPDNNFFGAEKECAIKPQEDMAQA